MFLIKNRIRQKKSLQKLRLSVFRSSKHIYSQIIDDKKGVTIVAASSLEKEIKKNKGITKSLIAFKVGKLLAQRAQSYGIKEVIFDRNQYLYHGRVKALAEGVRDKGLNF